MSGVDSEFEREYRRRETRTGRDFALHSVVVSYEDGADECTIYPRRLSCYERTSMWLTASVDTCIDLADAR